MGSFQAYPAVRFDECNVACWMSLGPCLLIVINERGLVARPDFAESAAGLSGGFLLAEKPARTHQGGQDLPGGANIGEG